MTHATPVLSHKTPPSVAAVAATALVTLLLAAPLWWLLTALLQQLGALNNPLKAPDDTRSALWLGVSLLLLCCAPARRLGVGLVARFDSVLLRPPASLDLAALATPCPTHTQLRQWVFDGVGTGASPLFFPNAIAAMERPLSVGVWEQADAMQQPTPSKALNAFMGQLDGTGLLLACGSPWAASLLRLRIKLREALWWRARQTTDPWDCGFLNTDEAALAQLKGFLPRRATLIVALNVPRQFLYDSLTALRHRQSLFGQPVRLLVIGTFDTEDFAPVFRVQSEYSAT
jgi:hypothetical protein